MALIDSGACVRAYVRVFGQCHVCVLVQFGKAVSLVQDMVRGGLQPDQFTFTAILNACQRANEAEVAFEVFR